MTEMIVFDFVERRVYAIGKDGETRPVSEPIEVVATTTPAPAE